MDGWMDGMVDDNIDWMHKKAVVESKYPNRIIRNCLCDKILESYNEWKRNQRSKYCHTILQFDDTFLDFEAKCKDQKLMPRKEPKN